MWRLYSPQVLLTLAAVVFLIAGAAWVFHSYYQPALSWSESFLFAVKAITTSGVPDKPSAAVEGFLIGFLPLSVFTWAAMVDALINRRPRP